MSYGGVIADIRIGRGGLMTDMNPLDIPDTHLILAENIEIQNGIIQKDPGSRKWNTSAAVLPSPIKALLDWFPSEVLQRFISVTAAGRVYKHPDPETATQITASGSAPTTLIVTEGNPIQIVAGGNEAPGDPRKAFIFTGNSQIQVISGDASVRTNITSPSADWDAATDVEGYPRGGAIHRSRLWVFLNHRIYASDPDDHENFVSNGIQFPIYPGEGERIVTVIVYKQRLFVMKYPFGLYVLNDADSSTSNWYFQKLSDEVGASGPDAHIHAMDDFLVSNSTGTVTSMTATQNLEGIVESADIFSILKVENYIRQVISPQGLLERRAIFYGEKKIAYFAARSNGGLTNNRIMKVDFSNQRPELTIVTKDQPNCFALRKVLNRKKPFYGADNGYIYEMDRADRNVGGSTYTMRFQTPYTNFAYLDPKLGQMNKNFDFLELGFVPTGRFDLTCDYFIDGAYINTITLDLDSGPALDDFELDTDRLTPNASFPVTKKLTNYGKTISFRFTQGSINQNIKLAYLRVYFRPSDEKRKNPNSGRA